MPAAAAAPTNTGTKITSRTTANETGLCVFAGVLSGPCRLVVEAAGMRKYEATPTARVREEDVAPAVTGDGPALSHVLERQRVEQLPINGREVASLLQTVPGMEGNRACGLHGGSREFVLDGAAMGNRYAEDSRSLSGV